MKVFEKFFMQREHFCLEHIPEYFPEIHSSGKMVAGLELRNELSGDNIACCNLVYFFLFTFIQKYKWTRHEFTLVIFIYLTRGPECTV